jgi:tuftelin-interacting protein 11
MARRKNGFLSDGSDSGDSDAGGSDDGFNSQEDGDSRAERALFEYNGSKRRKMAGGRGSKESAWEGIFGEDDEDGSRPGGRGIGAKRGGRGGRNGIGARSDVTKCAR